MQVLEDMGQFSFSLGVEEDFLPVIQNSEGLEEHNRYILLHKNKNIFA